MSPRSLIAVVLGLAIVVVSGLGFLLGGRIVEGTPRIEGRPPPAEGYFTTLPVGSWSSLPDDATCADRVHRSTWEPRPDNYAPNHRVPDGPEVREAFAVRPRARLGAYDPRWDTWLLPRVSGQFTGTTDEIVQWAACKWGLSDNLVRAVALQESGWYQGQVYSDGTCVQQSGCGDLFPETTRATESFCARVLTRAQARLYQRGDCPRTFSIVGVMSWHDPSWGRMPGNQNGTFPFNRDSTAYALDYFGSFVRGCYEGWITWLRNSGAYRAGRIWGCIGAWYAGSWDSPTAREYVKRVEAVSRRKVWLRPSWAHEKPPCSAAHGCPLAAP